MTSHIHPLLKSIRYAIEGLRESLIEEPNLRIHIIVGFAVICAGFFFQINKDEWLILLLTLSGVIVLELINTSVEALTDLVSPRIHKKAKLAKDVAAGAVLVSAIFAAIIGSIIFFPKALLMFGHYLY